MSVFIRLKSLAAILLFCAACQAQASPEVLFSRSGTYAFPLAGDVKDMAWTHFHWNGGNAVDIVPAPRLRPDSPGFAAFDRSPVVAVVAGTVQRADNELGGIALLLFGEDGREYYYAHLHSTSVASSEQVKAGQQIGTIGRTGKWARYIEIHLHFAISSSWHRGLAWKNDVNAAQWFKRTFGLSWIDQTAVAYGPAYPHGSPLLPPYRIVSGFAEMKSQNRDMASIRMAPVATAGLEQTQGSLPVFSTLLGEVRVMRGTVLGLRVQVTNQHTNQTVVYSGLSSTPLRTGDVVTAGELVGETRKAIDYMYFDRGILTDPAPTLAQQTARASSSSLLE